MLEAHRALVLLQADLLRDSAELADSRVVLTRQSAAAAWFQRNWHERVVDSDSAGYAFRAYLFIPRFTFPRSAFESLRAGNRLSLVQPDSVRIAVIEYYDGQSYLDVGYANLLSEKERTVDAFSPYFLRPPSQSPSSALPMAAGPAQMTSRWSIIQTDNTAYNQVSYSGAVAAVMLRVVDEQRDRNQRLLRLLRLHLAGPSTTWASLGVLKTATCCLRPSVVVALIFVSDGRNELSIPRALV